MDRLHDFGKGHGFVYTGNGKGKVLHHGAHHAVVVRWKAQSIERAVYKAAERTLLDHLLYCAGRVDLHCEEVVKAIYFSRILGELLTKSIGKVVGGICRLDGGTSMR
jgi:hypothetical protein